MNSVLSFPATNLQVNTWLELSPPAAMRLASCVLERGRVEV